MNTYMITDNNGNEYRVEFPSITQLKIWIEMELRFFAKYYEIMEE